MNLHNFYKALAQANEIIAKGGKILQQFTCVHCGAKQTMTDFNTFFTSGKCEECGQVTNIEAVGCNFAAIFGTLPSDKGGEKKSS